MPVTSYSRTPASNSAAPPNGAPEGWAPSSVNNVVRQIMTDIVNEAGKNSAKVLGSVAGTNTITAGMSPALDAYTAGMIVVFTPANTNNGAVTINIDSLGAIAISMGNGGALQGQELTAGQPAMLLMNSGANGFVLINNANDGVGSFTGTLTGMSGATTGTVSYRVVNNIVTLFLGSSILGTSNSNAMTMTGLPFAVRPVATRGFNCTDLNDNTNSNIQGGGTVSSGGVITFNVYNVSGSNIVRNASGFTSSGSKGLISQWQISYPLY